MQPQPTAARAPQAPALQPNATLWRRVALITIIFGLLVGFSLILELAPEADPTTPAYMAIQGLRVVYAVLALFVFTGLYARHYAHTGRGTLIGYAFLVCSFALLVALEFLFAFFIPFIAQQAPEFLAGLESGTIEPSPAMIIAFIGVDLLLLVGAGIFFTGVIKARQLPRAPAQLALVSLAFLAISDYFHEYAHVAAGVLFAASIIWLGLTLWQQNLPATPPKQGAPNGPQTA